MAPAEPLRRQAQPIAIAIAAQQSNRNPRLIASEPMSEADGQAAFFAANNFKTNPGAERHHGESRYAVEISTTRMDRFTDPSPGHGPRQDQIDEIQIQSP